MLQTKDEESTPNNNDKGDGQDAAESEPAPEVSTDAGQVAGDSKDEPAESSQPDNAAAESVDTKDPDVATTR